MGVAADELLAGVPGGVLEAQTSGCDDRRVLAEAVPRDALDFEASESKWGKAVGKDLKAVGEELKEPLREAKRGLDGAVPSGHEWTGPKPVSGPTPEDAMADLEKIEGVAEPNQPDEASE